MQTPPGDGGVRQDGTDTGLIDPPHNCPSPAFLSTPKAKYSPPYLGGANGGCDQHLNETGEDGTDLIWSRMGLEVTPASGTMRASRPSFVMARIKVLDERIFRPKKKGQWAATVGVNNRDSQLIDVCAFFLHDIHH